MKFPDKLTKGEVSDLAFCLYADSLCVPTSEWRVKDLRSEMEKRLADVCRAIRETVDVEQIWLFGSYAYGTPNEDSDLDILVVLPDEGLRPLDASVALQRPVHEAASMAVDIITVTLAVFDDRQQALTLEREIFEKGVKLYG